jgi:S-DNA-T family DNA segregation ATPase FtsK/SpoIIIE
MNQGTKIVAVVLFVLFVGTGVYYVTLSPANPPAGGAKSAEPPAAKPVAPRDPGAITMNPPAATGTAVAPPRIADPLAGPAAASPVGTSAGASASAPSTSTVAGGTGTAPVPTAAPRVTLGPNGSPTSVMPPLTVSRTPASDTATSVSGGTAAGVSAVRPTSPPASLTPAPTLASETGSSASSNSSPTTSTTAGAREHVVASGDTLSSIAARYLGSETRWEEIAKANPSVNPNSMRVGTKLSIPAGGSSPRASATTTGTATTAASTGGSAASSGQEYVVKPGDTLTGIARTTLGNADWEAIYEANRSVIGPNPAALKVGMKLSIPKRS